MKKIILFLLCICLLSTKSNSQVSQGGKPLSSLFELPYNFETIQLKKPNVDSLIIAAEENDSKGYAYIFGITIPVNVNMTNSGTWVDLPDKSCKIWRLKLICKDAKALSLYFDDYYMPPDCKLFIYNEKKTQILGAYTDANNHQSRQFANELIYGESVILEYIQPYNTSSINPSLSILQVAYAYRGVYNPYEKGFGSSGSCEVNVNCSEGNGYQSQKRGVAKIQVLLGSATGWCTGTLINNVNNNCTPFFLTADHCTFNFSTSTYCSSSDFNY